MKILIVDDEQDIRDALGRKLRRESFDVFLAWKVYERSTQNDPIWSFWTL
jgi:DNA-binding response OmpR family regulator